MTPVGKKMLLPARVARLVHALRRIGAEAEACKIEIPSGEPPCHWYLALPAGLDPQRVDPETPFGHGTSFLSDEEALSRAFGELTERWCLSLDERASLVRASYADLRRRGFNALDPRSVAGLSDKFREAYPRHRFDGATVFAWVEGRTFPFWQRILVPAQLVYVPYASGRGEPRIRQPLSTGAAFGWTFLEAFWRGVAEVVERDAFMVHWLAKLAPARIDLAAVTNSVLQELVAAYRGQGVEVHALDTTLDAGIPTALVVLLERSGQSPAVVVGSRTSFDISLALREALGQAHGIRAGIQSRFHEWRKQGSPPVAIKDSIPARVLFWAGPERIEELSFLLQNQTVRHWQRGPSPGAFRSLVRAWRTLPQSFGELIVVDLTPAALKPVGRVVKAILSGAQPLHLSETFPNFGGARWRQFAGSAGGETCNPLPHPFI